MYLFLYCALFEYIVTRYMYDARRRDFALSARFVLKWLCQLESMCAEVIQITSNCQNSIVFNA